MALLLPRRKRLSLRTRTVDANTHVSKVAMFVAVSSFRDISRMPERRSWVVLLLVTHEPDIPAVDAGADKLRIRLFVPPVAARRRRVILAQETPVLFWRRPARSVIAIVPTVVVAEGCFEIVRTRRITGICFSTIRRDQRGR